MFCASCGNQVNPGLRYCNSCGARLVSANELDSNDRSSGRSFNLLVSAMMSIPIAGLGIMIGLLVVMKKVLGFPDPMIVMLAAMAFLLLFVAEVGLFWLLVTRSREARKSAREFDAAPAQMGDVVKKGLNEGTPFPASGTVPSVTEHTTRTLSGMPLDTKRH